MAIRRYRGVGRLPRLGKIHLGVKAVNDKGVEYPKAVDYFVLPPELQAIYGEKPKELRVMFLRDDIDRVASLYYRAYGASTGLVCRGDGDIANAVVDKLAWQRAGHKVLPGIWATSESKQTERVEIPCAGEGDFGDGDCPHYHAKKCRRVLMLQVLIMGAPRIGVYQIDTGSYYGALNVLGFLEMLQEVFGGHIAGLPMILRIADQEVAPDGKKKTVHVLQLTAEGNAERFLALASMPIQQAVAATSGLALPEGRGDEAAIVEAEVVEPDESKLGMFSGDPDDLPPDPDAEAHTEPTTPTETQPVDAEPVEDAAPEGGGPSAGSQELRQRPILEPAEDDGRPDPRRQKTPAPPAPDDGPWTSDVMPQAEALGFTQELALTALNMKDPADFHRRKLTVQVCVGTLKAIADFATQQNKTIAQAVSVITNRRQNGNGKQ